MDVCAVHSDREAVSECEKCGKLVCKKCRKIHIKKEYEGFNQKRVETTFCSECYNAEFNITKGTKICAWIVVGIVIISVLTFIFIEYVLPLI